MIKRSLIVIAISMGLLVQAQDSGVVRGRIVDRDGQPLAGVAVHLQPGGMKTVTDSIGQFTLTGVSVGDHTLVMNFFGYGETEASIAVKAGVNALDTITMAVMPETDVEIKVAGSLREGQARALNQQRLAPNIKSIVAADQIGNFPDSNAAEATQRVPGVNILRDQGEGRYVLVRGTEARLNKNTINGVSLPAPEGDLRTVAMDVIPLDMLEAIEVSKAVTPEMDGDAVGGAVNLVTRKAPFEPRFTVGLAGGYNQQSEDNIAAGNILFGKRFAGDKLGVIASLSYDETDRGSDNFEVAYDDGLPEELEQRDYEVNRKRIGSLMELDYDPNERMSFQLTTSYAQFDDQEFRRRVTSVIPDGELERELKDRFETQSIISAKLGGSIFTASGSEFSFSVSHAYAREVEPGRLDTNFVQEDVVFNPNYASAPFNGFNIQPNPQNEDFSRYELDDIAREDNTTNDEHNAISLAYEMPVLFGDNNLARFKFGGKYRSKEKFRDVEVTKMEADGLFLSDFIDPNYNENDFLDGQYDMGSFHGRNQVRRLMASNDLEMEKDFEEDAADYLVEENQTAVYGMATLELDTRWTLVGGLRFESIEADYTGFEVLFDDAGDYVSTNPVTGGKTDDLLMPNFHAVYKLDDRTQLRGAVTRTYARARVFDQVPYRLILEEDREIEEGNPEIEMTDVWNLDLMFERYLGDAGLFSAGVFYKDMNDYIYTFNRDAVVDGENFEIIKPLNGDTAELLGLELAFQKNFTSLPAPFDGLGVFFNYTYTDSDATLSDRNIRLPGQAEETGNLQLIYERNGWSFRLAANRHGEYILEVGDEAAEDVWVEEHTQLDLTASYTMRDLKLYLEMVNLTDEEFVIYEGSPELPIQLEQYKIWGRLGFKYSF